MPEETWLTDGVFYVEDFLTADECAKLIVIAEEFGFEEALLSSPKGAVRRSDIRNNDRVLFESVEMAEELWEKTADFVPSEYDDRPAVGLNELFRFYRYTPGQQFHWDQDFPFERETGEKSYLTMLIYLNADFEGGETSFEDSYSAESFDAFQVVPKQGMALFFEHPTHHQGEAVLSGRKYVLRTDVMYAAEEGTPSDWADDEEFEDDW